MRRTQRLERFVRAQRSGRFFDSAVWKGASWLMAQVFISYKHDDGDFATILKQHVERAGFSAWQDDSLAPGEDWRAGIDEAIRHSCALVVIMTPEARASEYVTYEWAYALGVGVPVIPVMLKKTALHPRLEALQHLDFTHRQSRPWSKLANRLRDVQGEPTPAPVAVPRPAPGDTIDLLEQLRARDWYTRRDAAQILGGQRNLAAVPLLAHIATGDRSIRVREAAAEALGWIGDEAAIPELVQALRDEHPKVRDAAARALRRIGTPDALAALDQNH